MPLGKHMQSLCLILEIGMDYNECYHLNLMQSIQHLCCVKYFFCCRVHIINCRCPSPSRTMFYHVSSCSIVLSCILSCLFVQHCTYI